ncbi:MAG: hypothetical protein H7Z43_01565 [Clostridia bacterium]|nr:hypothetical protein [Deltaproteobacteria bacterium]
MHGIRLRQLNATYRTLSRTLGLNVLCLQETLEGHTESVGDALGGAYMTLAHPNEGLGLVYDSAAVELREEALIPLPKLIAMPRYAGLYMKSRHPEQKYALACTVTPRDGSTPFTLVNFHLDAAGTNVHRSAQLRFAVDRLRARDLTARLIACGDANVFALRAHGQAYKKLLAPLSELGCVDNETRPTHFFARSREPRYAQRILRQVGKLGLDAPRRYDVICSNITTPARGQVETPDSDHDLLWVRLKGQA